MKTGTMVTWSGTIMVARMTPNSRFLPRNCMLANVYPASAAVNIWPNTHSAVTSALFQISTTMSTLVNTSE